MIAARAAGSGGSTKTACGRSTGTAQRRVHIPRRVGCAEDEHALVVGGDAVHLVEQLRHDAPPHRLMTRVGASCRGRPPHRGRARTGPCAAPSRTARADCARSDRSTCQERRSARSATNPRPVRRRSHVRQTSCRSRAARTGAIRRGATCHTSRAAAGCASARRPSRGGVSPAPCRPRRRAGRWDLDVVDVIGARAEVEEPDGDDIADDRFLLAGGAGSGGNRRGGGSGTGAGFGAMRRS